MITFTDEDKEIRDALQSMDLIDAKLYFQSKGYSEDGGCFKRVFIHPKKDYVIKLCGFEPDARRNTPYQTVRAIDGFDLTRRMRDGDREWAQSARERFREVFGIKEFKKYRAKDYYFGQGKDFIFVFQEKLTPFRSLPTCTTRNDQLYILRNEIQELSRNKVQKKFSCFHADLHDGNWGVDDKGRLVLFDGA